MENASKALIMAASVLIAIVIISAFVLMMSNLTSYQESSYQSNLSAQIAEFNNQYTTYDRSNIRGSDMISLMNKVSDYNTRYTGEEGFTKMQITVRMNGYNDELAFDGTNRIITQSEYTQDNIYLIVGQPTLKTVNGSNAVTSEVTSGPIRAIENKYQQKYCNQLSSEISNIQFIMESDIYRTTSEKNQAFDDEKILPNPASSYGEISVIYEDALKYYEYIQFKRAYFDCVGEPEYDNNTGRILKMEFECTGIGV